MKKKNYVKPEIKLVELRIEERLADCSWYTSRLAIGGCTTQQYQIDPIPNCFHIDAFAGS